MSISDFDDSEISVITKFIKNSNQNSYIDVLFNNNINGFLDCVSNYNNKKLMRSHELDIIYNHVNNIQYKIIIDDLEKINSYVNFLKENPNNKIVSSLIKNITDSHIKYEKSEIIDNISISDYELKFVQYSKSSLEKTDKDLLGNLSFNDKYEIFIILKDKLINTIIDDEYCKINIILQSYKKVNNIFHIVKNEPKYHVSIEIHKKKDFKSDKYTLMLLKELTLILKIINKTNIIIKKSYKNEILFKYSQLVFQKDKIYNVFVSRKPIALDIRGLVYDIPNLYSITDKADGERHLLFVDNKNVLLISSNMEIKHTGIVLNTLNYHNTIIDGELLLLGNSHLFMAFDILYLKNKNMRDFKSLPHRISLLTGFMSECFNMNINNNDSKLKNVKDIVDFHNKTVDTYITNLKREIQTKSTFIVWMKYYIFPKGIENNEIFKYSQIIWNKFTDINSNYPYKLDGLIYTPLNREYSTQLNTNELAVHEYKLKPINQLSIDFYIEIEIDPQTKTFKKVFDKTVSNKYYYICNLYVNDVTNKSNHTPQLFRKKYNEHFTYLPLEGDSNVAMDTSGNIIINQTVIEFKYNKELPVNFRWVPIKNRPDKTETIHKYSRNYGNNLLTANYIWEIIQNPITFDNINILASNNYENIMEQFKQKLNQNVGEQYYEHKTGLVLPMRAFHNYIKDNLISVYCSPNIKNKISYNKTVLDIGVGRGGDLLKFFVAGVTKIVGIDVDNTGFTIPNGALDKFNNLKSRKNYSLSVLPPTKLKSHNMDGIFIQMDLSENVDLAIQEKIFPDMDSDNKKLITDNVKDLSFDTINCQFTIHYMFNSEGRVKQLFTNINKLLKPNGYMIISCFDGDAVMKKLEEDNGEFNISYINNKGANMDLFKIIRQYSDKDKSNNFNLPIDVYNYLYSKSGKIEYLVKKDVLVSYAKEYGNLQLVESQMFSSFYELNRSIIHYLKSNNNLNNKIQGSINNLYKFYNFESILDQDSLNFSKLNRYYVFKKM